MKEYVEKIVSQITEGVASARMKYCEKSNFPDGVTNATITVKLDGNGQVLSEDESEVATISFTISFAN
jgi:hypothetical protein